MCHARLQTIEHLPKLLFLHLSFIQAINAAPYGVVGVLVYTDPFDINDRLMSDANETYPHSWYLPPSGVERGAFGSSYGDPLTPYLAAKGNHRLLLCVYRLLYTLWLLHYLCFYHRSLNTCKDKTAVLTTVLLINLQRKRTESCPRTSRGFLPFQFSQSDSRTLTR